MAYRRKTTRKTRARKTSYRKAAPKRRKTASKRRSSTKRAPRQQKIVLVIQQAPVGPTLATPAAKAAPVRARFGG